MARNPNTVKNHHGTAAPREGEVRPSASLLSFVVSLCRLGSIFALSVCFAGFAFGQGAEPVFSATGFEAEAYGADKGYPTGAPRREQRFLVGNLSNGDRDPNRVVARGEKAWEFKRARQEFEIAYAFKSEPHTLAGYLSRHPTTGLLIARDDTILYERYQYARTDKHRFASQSMAKTVTSMLLGIAVSEGHIRSLDEPAEAYVPGLKGREYGRTPIRALLHMASGVAFVENYDGKDDVMRMAVGLRQLKPGEQAAAVVGQFNDRVAPPGTVFKYASVESEILGLVLMSAIKRPVAEYLSEKIWRPIGAEADAAWLVDGSGVEMASCCLNAVLRDYARLGRLLAHDGAWDGKQIVPRQWVLDATTVRPENQFLAPKPGIRYYGYGYQVWIFPGVRRMFAFLGTHGQSIFVDPLTKLVMVHTAARVKPSADPAQAETRALWHGLVALLGKE